MRSLRFSVRGQLLFIRGGHLRLPLQHPSGEGRHGTILHCLPGPDHQIEKAAGDLAFAQLFLNAQIAPLAMVGGMAASGGVLAGAEMRHGSSPFSIGQDSLTARRLNRAWVTWAAISEARRQFSSKQAAADRSAESVMVRMERNGMPFAWQTWATAADSISAQRG